MPHGRALSGRGQAIRTSRRPGPRCPSLSPFPSSPQVSPDETFQSIPSLHTLLHEAEALHDFITTFLLDVNSTDVHAEAASFLRATYASCSSKRQLSLLSSMVSLIPSLPAFGRKATAFIALFRELLANASHTFAGAAGSGAGGDQDVDECRHCLLTVFTDLSELLGSTFQKQNRLVAGHPNAHLYESLRSVVHSFNGYFLESDPCLVCSDADMVPYAEQMLTSLQLETKYSTQTIFTRLRNSYSIKRVDIYVSDSKQVRFCACLPHGAGSRGQIGVGCPSPGSDGDCAERVVLHEPLWNKPPLHI